MERYAGIDPGLTGAVAVVSDELGLLFFDTPVVTVAKGKGTRHEYDVQAMHRILAAMADGRTRIVILETQQAMPASVQGRKQGTASSFSTGFGFGLWLGLLAANALPYELVRPGTWKREMVGLKAEKDMSRIVAQRLFPLASENLKRKKDHGRADALLLAEWGRRRVGADAVPNGGPF